MPVLTAVDVIGIQSYVFASNRLRDVVGASQLVDWATNKESGLQFQDANIPSPEIIVAAGGNAVLRFENLDDAKQYVVSYTRRLLEHAPGLEVAIAHFPYLDGQLARALLALQIELAKSKLNRRPHAPQLGLSVMQPCAVTGFPASVWRNQESEWVSSRIARIREQNATGRWHEFLPQCIDRHAVRFPNELDQMGRYGELNTCRRKYLLNYFDEQAGTYCGHCDICLTRFEQIDGTLLAQKALSAVTRLQERFGAGYVIDFLRGSESAKIREEHKEIKTYGVGADVSKEAWNALIRDLLTQGYLTKSDGKYPVLQLTAESALVLSGEQKVMVTKTKERIWDTFL